MRRAVGNNQELWLRYQHLIEKIRAAADPVTADLLAEALLVSNIGSEMMGEAKGRVDDAMESHVAKNPDIADDLKDIQAYLSAMLKKLFR